MFGPLHKLNPLRLEWIDGVTGGLAGRAVVDVGCGGGILAESMAAKGARVLGIDLGDKALGVAKLHKLESGTSVDYRLVAAETLAAETPGAYDVVTCMELLEHVPDPASMVAACGSLVKAGGTVVFSTINRNAKSYALRRSSGPNTCCACCRAEPTITRGSSSRPSSRRTHATRASRRRTSPAWRTTR